MGRADNACKGKCNICSLTPATNFCRHKIRTRQHSGLQSRPGNPTVMWIIRNNFSHTGYNAPREGSHSRELGQSWRWDRVKKWLQRWDRQMCKVGRWSKEGLRNAGSWKWPTSDGEPANAHIVRHSKKLRILRLVQSEELPTPSPTFCPLQVPLWRGQFTLKQDFGWAAIWFGHTGPGRIYQWGVFGGGTECGPGKFMGQQGPGTVVRLSSRHVQFIANNCQINHAFLRKLSNFMWQLFDQCPINNRHVKLDDRFGSKL